MRHKIRDRLDMIRPLRLEFPGALYHVTARGKARAAIHRDDAGRVTFPDLYTEHFGVYYATVSQMVRRHEIQGRGASISV